MAKTQTVTCDFCEPGQQDGPAATIQICVDDSGGRVPFDACAKCAAEKLGQLSEKLAPKKPEPAPEPA